ncbi:hypothetical protein B2G71_17765 [Novosphingobium sp. PC22D]|uniref:alpha/beta hydrolase family protein n=1 Tax=Novosphingobium sp. PC22D TaxID=1962403 RepID=UPI000BEFA652|nr:alpha/beta hydrolase [Novosphingobium sp. PC22D]PEQ11399.1 hypothetical protein B2G71_17765 [Novosphingobium sp. PC22D]
MTSRRELLGLLAGLPLLSLSRPALAASRKRVITAPGGRRITVTVWNASGERQGYILFSHGFRSAPEFYPDWIAAWAGAGFEVHAPLHTDSLQHPLMDKPEGLPVWKTRVEDMRAVSRAIGADYVCAGHSFGGLMALVAGGVTAETPEGITGPLADPRARAVIALSPPGPLKGLVSKEAFSHLARPALVQTGTRDVLPGRDDPESWREHLTAFAEALPSGDRHALLLEGVDHYFGGLVCDPAKTGPDQHAQLALVSQVTLAFLARYAPGRDAENRAPLAAPRSPLLRLYHK